MRFRVWHACVSSGAEIPLPLAFCILCASSASLPMEHPFSKRFCDNLDVVYWEQHVENLVTSQRCQSSHKDSETGCCGGTGRCLIIGPWLLSIWQHRVCSLFMQMLPVQSTNYPFLLCWRSHERGKTVRQFLSFLVSWFNPRQQLSTTQLLTHTHPPVGWGRDSEKWKTPGLS